MLLQNGKCHIWSSPLRSLITDSACLMSHNFRKRVPFCTCSSTFQLILQRPQRSMRTSISGRRANRRDDAPLAASAAVPLLRGLITATIITLARSLVRSPSPIFGEPCPRWKHSSCCARRSVTPSSTISGGTKRVLSLDDFQSTSRPHSTFLSLFLDKSGINISQPASKTVFASDLLSRKLP